MDEQPVLLSVTELGGYPDFTSLYRALGYQVVAVNSIRKALSALKKVDPQVVVAEFNYAPTYGARISSIEPLLARLQTHHPMSCLIVFAEPERTGYLAQLKPAYGDLPVLTYPIQVQRLEALLRQA